MREEFFADVCEFGFLILVVLNFVDFMSKFVDYLSKLVFVARFLFVEFDESFLHGEQQVFNEFVVLYLLVESYKSIIYAHLLQYNLSSNYNYSNALLNQLFIELKEYSNQMTAAHTLNQLIVHLTTHPHIHHPTRLLLQLFTSLQLIPSILNPQSHLFIILRWADFSTFIEPSVIGVCGLLLMGVLLMTVVWKLVNLKFVGVWRGIEEHYLSNVIVHLWLVLSAVLFVPLLKVSVKQIHNSQQVGFIYILSIINLSLFFSILLPLHLLMSFNTYLFTNRTDNTLHFINSHLIFEIFRITVAVIHPLGAHQIITPVVLFVLMYLIITIKRPVVYYHNDAYSQSMIAWVVGICIFFLAGKMESSSSLSAIQALVGMISFGFAIQAISKMRIKQILSLKKPTNQQMKILFYLMVNIQHYPQLLEHFILKHSQTCDASGCKCQKILQVMRKKVGEEVNQSIWWQFACDLLKRCFKLQEMKVAVESKMRERINKYENVVTDLAQIYLFKLNRTNEAFTMLHNFKYFIQERDISYTTFNIKENTLLHLIYQQSKIKFQNESNINFHAHQYFSFQQISQRYRKNLVMCAGHVLRVWEEMGKREPDEVRVREDLMIVEQSNKKIKKLYLQIVEQFKGSNQILDHITNSYFSNVLNISEKSKLHVIPQMEQQSHQKAYQQLNIIEQNIKHFSFNSHTPTCLISMHCETLGSIVARNHFFNYTLGCSAFDQISIEQLMIPELREWHKEKMSELMLKDQYKYKHEHSLIWSDGKLIFCNIFVQIVPSLSEGLRYAAFFKTFQPIKKIFCVKNKIEIIYTSEAFDKHHYSHHELFLQFIEDMPAITNQPNQTSTYKFQNSQWKIYFKTISQSQVKEDEYVFIEVINDPQNDDAFSKANLYSTLQYKFVLNDKTKSSDFREYKKENGFEESSIGSKGSKMMEDMKKIEEVVSDSYVLVVSESKVWFVRKMRVVCVGLVLGLIGCFMALAIFKQADRENYLSGFTINTNYHNFILNVSKSVMHLQDTNFWLNKNNTANAQASFNKLKNIGNMNTAMDKFIKLFDLPVITENWITFSCIASNNTLKAGQSNNFLTFFDFYQNQMNKLTKTSLANLSFPPSKKLMKAPLTSSECEYLQLTMNGLYVQLPGFINLKEKKMNEIIQARVSRSSPIIIIFSTIIFISLVYVVATVSLKNKVTTLKNQTFSLFEGITKPIIDDKEMKCREFIDIYAMKASEELRESTSAPQNFGDGEIGKNNTFSAINKSISINLDKILDIQTDRSLEDKKKVFQPQQSGDQPVEKLTCKMRKKKSVFLKISLSSIVWRYLLIALPFILVSIAFLVVQVTQGKNIKAALQIQQKFQKIDLNLNLLRIYAQLHGFADPQMSKYLNPDNYLLKLTSQVYNIVREVINKRLKLQKFNNFNSLLEEGGYGNLCKFINQSTIFSQKSVEKCMQTNNQIIPKGLYSMIVNYLENLNNLIMMNPSTNNFTKAQLLDYLGTQFFVDKQELIPYFDQLIAALLQLLYNDYKELVRNLSEVYVWVLGSLLLGWMVAVLWWEWCKAVRVEEDLNEIRSLLETISLQTIVEKEEVRNGYLRNLDLFNSIE